VRPGFAAWLDLFVAVPRVTPVALAPVRGSPRRTKSCGACEAIPGIGVQ